MVKTRMDQNQRIAQNQKGFFLEETKSKKCFWEEKLRREVFKKGLNDLLQTKQGFCGKQKQQNFWSVTAPTPLGKISSPRFQLILK